MHEKSICSYCGDDQSPVQTRFFYQVTVEQILAGMDFYKSMQIEQRDYLATLICYENWLSSLSSLGWLSRDFL